MSLELYVRALGNMLDMGPSWVTSTALEKKVWFSMKQTLGWRFAHRWFPGLAFLRGSALKQGGQAFIPGIDWSLDADCPPGRGVTSDEAAVFFWPRAVPRKELSCEPMASSILGTRGNEWPTAASATRASDSMSCQKDSKCAVWSSSIWLSHLVTLQTFLSYIDFLLFFFLPFPNQW